MQVTSIFPQLLCIVCQCTCRVQLCAEYFPLSLTVRHCSSLFRLVDACTSCFRVPSARFYRSYIPPYVRVSTRTRPCVRRFEISPGRGTLDDGRQESRRERESTRELKRTYFRGFFWYTNSEHRILAPFPPLLRYRTNELSTHNLSRFLQGLSCPSSIADSRRKMTIDRETRLRANALAVRHVGERFTGAVRARRRRR